MLMPKANRVAIYEQLFKDGVMVAEKNTKAPKHPELETIPNLQVIKALTSLKSKGYVKEQFAWRHFYWYLTTEGVSYLRDYLHLPSEIVPATTRRQAPSARATRSTAPRAERKEADGDAGRSEYRRAAGAESDKAAEAGPGAGAMEFRGGYGRGKPAQ
uniref:40S ribosomal protein S10 n=1 Tax=Pseudodiaptomus poplesia TaxID=213370 RepID=A0A0U2V2H0_9MAXI|nr:40S ribosomal protein S10 [Pseudodiaptomus poplesia]